MANVKKVEMVEIKYWSALGAWTTMKKKTGETISDLTTIDLYSDETGFDPTEGLAAVLKWDAFTVAEVTDYTIFGATGGLIAENTPSIKIRYKLKTTSAGTPDTTTTTDGFYYQIVNFSVPATGVVSGLVAAITGTITATITVNVPGFNAAMANPDAYQALMSYMLTAAAWNFTWGLTAGDQPEVTPFSITIGIPTSTSVTEYGGVLIPISAKLRLPVSTSGEYTLSASFQPNDEGSLLAMGTMTSTATVTVNVATQGDTTLFSDDESLQFNLSFTA